MPITVNEMGTVRINIKDGSTIARVIRAGVNPHIANGVANEQGAQQLWAALVVENEAGQEFEVYATCAPWLGFVHESILEMAQHPDQRYEGFGLNSKDGNEGKVFYNIMSLKGITKPANWDDQLEAMGLARNNVKANNTAPMLPPKSSTARAQAVNSGPGLDD